MSKQRKAAKITKCATVVLDTPDRQRALYWCVVPEGMTEEEAFNKAWNTPEVHGPFETEAQVKEDQRITLVGPQGKVVEGGMWDPAWDKPQ